MKRGIQLICVLTLLPLMSLAGLAGETVNLPDKTVEVIDNWDGKCPVCKREGLRSKVYTTGCSADATYTPEHWDEDGKYHKMEITENFTSCHYHCTRDHQFIHRYR